MKVRLFIVVRNINQAIYEKKSLTIDVPDQVALILCELSSDVVNFTDAVVIGLVAAAKSSHVRSSVGWLVWQYFLFVLHEFKLSWTLADLAMLRTTS